MLTATFCLALMMPQGPNAPVVINEFSYDDSGTDDREFVELYNATGSTIDIGDWVLDSEDEVGPNPAYTIPTGTMLASGDYWVMGSPTVANIDQPLAPGTNLWENGGSNGESLTLRDNNGRIVDTLVYEANKGFWTTGLNEGEGVWGNFTSIDGYETSWSRWRDGRDTGDNGNDFGMLPSTPGTSNRLAGFCANYAENFDAITPEADVPGWGRSFVLPKSVDPTTPSASHPNAIAASPQGGNCGVIWDASGGGNTVFIPSEVGTGMAIETWVYIDGNLTTSTAEWTNWSIGFGTTASFANRPDASGALGGSANGNVGVSWTYEQSDTSNVLYLLDHNNGGWAPGAISGVTTVGSVAITAGSNDGWQRLYLEMDPVAGTVSGAFGGTFGSGTGTGTSFSMASTLPRYACVFCGYRENDGVSGVPAWVTPLYVDDFQVNGLSDAAMSNFGVAAPTTSSTPTIGANGLPTLGNSGWQLNIAGLVPSSPFALWMGIPAVTPFDLQTIGGQANSFVYLDLAAPILILNLAADGTGAANPGAPVPCMTSIAGATVGWQVFGVDLALATAIKVANTDRLDTTFGY